MLEECSNKELLVLEKEIITLLQRRMNFKGEVRHRFKELELDKAQDIHPVCKLGRNLV